MKASQEWKHLKSSSGNRTPSCCPRDLPLCARTALLHSAAIVATELFSINTKDSETLELFKSEIRIRDQFQKKKKPCLNCHSDLPYTVQKQTAK